MKPATKIILSVGVIVLLAALVALGLYLSNQSRSSDNATSGPRVGDTVALEETPTLGACAVVNEDDLRAIMQRGIIEIAEPSRSGVVAPNLNIADQCTYAFTTPKADKNSLTIEVFNVSADPNNTADILDASWSLDIDAERPSFYKEAIIDGVKYAYLRVILGAQSVQWTLQQPEASQQFNLTDQRFILLSLSERANYAAVTEAAEAALETDLQTEETAN